jgi:hypothetical protein
MSCLARHFYLNNIEYSKGENKMGSILQSLQRTIIAGVVLLVLIIAAVTTLTGNAIAFDHAWGAFVMRWLRISRCYVDWLVVVFQLCANSIYAKDS